MFTTLKLRYCDTVSIFSGNCRQFWKYIRAKHKDASRVSPLLVNDSLVSDSVGKAAAVSDQFQSMFTREDVSNIPNLNDIIILPPCLPSLLPLLEYNPY